MASAMMTLGMARGTKESTLSTRAIRVARRTRYQAITEARSMEAVAATQAVIMVFLRAITKSSRVKIRR